MAEPVFVIGPSGSGKSTAGRTLDPKTTLWINADKKALPFPGWAAAYNESSKNYLKSSNAAIIAKALMSIPEKAPHIKTVVIDTLNRIMTDKVMQDRNIKGYDKWTNLAGDVYDILKAINEKMPDDIVVFILTHSTDATDEFGTKSRRALVAGKMLEKLVLESMATIVLFTRVDAKDDGADYYLETQTDGETTAKSPMGMFDSFLVPNDLQLVNSSIIKHRGV